MKIIVQALFWTSAVGLELFRQSPGVLDKGLELHSFRQPPVALETIEEEELLNELKHRISICGERKGSKLQEITTEELLKEFKRREEAKDCPPPAAAPAPAAAAPVAGDSAAPGAPGAPAPVTTTTTTTTGPDNFADEVVDQANVQFTMLDKDKDGCISTKEMTKTLKDQVNVAKSRNYYWQLQNITRGRKEIVSGMKDRVNAADVDGDGCLSREEFEELHHAVGDCSKQFMMMDHSGDGKVSRQEAATYVSDHMDSASLSYDKLRSLFKTSDVNHDNYLSEQEFCEAGTRFKGDGNDK